MAATRFYFGSVDSDNPVSPGFDGNWEQTGQATRRKLYVKRTFSGVLSALTNKQVTVPITTTQDILNVQFVSDPIPARVILGNFSMVLGCLESATTANAHLAGSLRVVSQDGGTVRGTLWSSFTTITEFANAAIDTRIIAAVAITALTTLPGDRLVLEVGVRAAAPSAATNANQRFGTSAVTGSPGVFNDFALTSGLTTDLNPWAELSQDLFAQNVAHYQAVRGGSGMGFSERVR